MGWTQKREKKKKKKKKKKRKEKKQPNYENGVLKELIIET